MLGIGDGLWVAKYCQAAKSLALLALMEQQRESDWI